MFASLFGEKRKSMCSCALTPLLLWQNNMQLKHILSLLPLLALTKNTLPEHILSPEQVGAVFLF
jgi:hypothetical protein